MKHLVLLLSIFISISPFFGQNATEEKIINYPHSYLSTGGLVSYYFWEEDSLGFIDARTISKPFLQNYVITTANEVKNPTDLSIEQLQKLVTNFAHQVTISNEKKHFVLIDDSTKNETKINFYLNREMVEKQMSVAFRKQNGQWYSSSVGKVNYFIVDNRNRLRYEKTSDSILLKKYSISVLSNGPYEVYSYLDKNGAIEKQEVYSYSGQNVSTYLLTKQSLQSEKIIVFINGYRGPKKERDETDHLVTSKDRFNYWFKVDDRFIKILNPQQAFYIDGSMSIHTSNHRTFLNFARSLVRSSYIFRKKAARDNFNRLNTEANPDGFQLREEKGKIGGKALLAALCNSPACEGVQDTIDIVCHSMGYAYTLGLIEELKGKVVFRNIYIIAPENGCQAGQDWSLFKHVWQYGSNLDQKDADPLWEQDGIAPQCAVKGIEELDPSVGGRAFFPKDWKRKNFIDSHMLYNYDWIFDTIKKGEKGYIGK